MFVLELGVVLETTPCIVKYENTEAESLAKASASVTTMENKVDTGIISIIQPNRQTLIVFLC
jgi:hypothetical protein